MINVLCVASDDYAEKYYQCIKSQDQFCNLHQYNFVLVKGHKDSRNWKRSKVEELYKLLTTQSNDVLLIDCDCLIKKETPKLETFLIKEKSIYYVKGKSGRLNSGFLYFKNNAESKKFVEDIFDRFSKTVPASHYVTKEGENGHIIWLQNDYLSEGKDIFFELSKLWNCSSLTLEKEAYVLHFTNDLKKKYTAYNDYI